MEKEIASANSTPNTMDDLFALAALFEGDFSIDLIQNIMQEKTSRLLLFIDEGIRQKWLAKKGPGLFCFCDLKTKEKYGSLLGSDETLRLHKKIAKSLMHEFPDNESAQILVHHLLHITNDEKGCRWLMKAGDHFLSTYQTEKALQCYAKILEDLEHNYTKEANHIFVDAATKYSEISTAKQATTKLIAILQDALKRAKQLDNRIFQVLATMYLAKTEWSYSKYESALRNFESGWAMAKDIDDLQALRAVNTFIPFFFFFQGRFQDAVNYYEKAAPDVEYFPKATFSQVAALTVGLCYAYTGQVTQGIGMVDAVRSHFLEKGNGYRAADASLTLALIFLELEQLEDALQYIEHSVAEAKKFNNYWSLLQGRLTLAFAYYLKKDNKRSVAHLRDFLKLKHQIKFEAQAHHYILEFCWAMENGRYPRLPGFSFEKEIRKMIRSKSLFLKGIAWRYKALAQQSNGASLPDVIKAIKLSLGYFEKTGHKIEFAKTQFELTRCYLLLGEEDKAKDIALNASKILSPISDSLIPDCIRPLVDQPLREKTFDEIIKLSQEMGTIHNHKDLTQNIISTVNRITGAERGAIFLFEKSSTRKRELQLRASKNITLEQINHPDFSSSLKMANEVACSGEGRIIDSISGPHSPTGGMIRSRICVPMYLRDKVTGVLYHDNRLLRSVFKESDLKLLSYFAGQAAIALDNANAYEEIKRLNRKLKEEKLYYEEQQLQPKHSSKIIGKSVIIKRLLDDIHQVAKTNANVLILGETGVGKDVFAQEIHKKSDRCASPYINVQCSALPESLITSELFGHEKGAFTGANSLRIGRFELADKGTLFLDEVGTLPHEVQVRLLRVLQDGEFERVGGSVTLHSDFRLIAATNVDLENEVKAGRFRADLYYRLNIFPIHVPPLRERAEDIPLLAHHFLRKYSYKWRKPFKRISDSQMEQLLRYDWPGNVRELENIIERCVILSSKFDFEFPDLNARRMEYSSESMALANIERNHILFALQKTKWKVYGSEGTAELLEINPHTLASRMKKLGIMLPRTFRKQYHTVSNLT